MNITRNQDGCIWYEGKFGAGYIETNYYSSTARQYFQAWGRRNGHGKQLCTRGTFQTAYAKLKQWIDEEE